MKSENILFSFQAPIIDYSPIKPNDLGKNEVRGGDGRIGT